MTRHRGSTLVELVLIMGAGSAVMLLGISLVHQSLTLSEKSRSRTDRSRTLDQLAYLFRSDLHSADEVQSLTDGSMTMQSQDGSIVTYMVKGNFVVRERRRATTGDERERFLLEDNSTARFEMITNPKRARLTVAKELGLPGVPLRIDLTVEALVGRWQILERDKRGIQ